METYITNSIKTAIALKQALLQEETLLKQIDQITVMMIKCFQQNARVWFCGNGGSAADAQHLAAELSGRFYYDRPPLFAEAMHVNSAYLTAVANDYGYEQVFARLVDAKAQPNDILVAMSTSGNSPNIIAALKRAQQKKITTIGLTGKNGGHMNGLCEVLLKVPSNDTPRIQEVHMLIGHIVCAQVEKILFPQ